METLEAALADLRKGSRSTRFPTLSLQAMTPQQCAVAGEIFQSRRSLDGPFNALLRSPELADCAQRMGAYLRFKSGLPARLREFAILIVARYWTAQYEWFAHRQIGLQAGLSPAICDALQKGECPADLDRDEDALFQFVADLLVTGHTTDAAFSRIVESFGEAGASDLIGLVGYYSLVSFFLNVDRYPLPEGAKYLDHAQARFGQHRPDGHGAGGAGLAPDQNA